MVGIFQWHHFVTSSSYIGDLPTETSLSILFFSHPLSRQILGNRSNINVGLAEFYLQMNGWNVDEAISSYLDVNRCPDLSMTLIQVSCCLDIKKLLLNREFCSYFLKVTTNFPSSMSYSFGLYSNFSVVIMKHIKGPELKSIRREKAVLSRF